MASESRTFYFLPIVFFNYPLHILSSCVSPTTSILLKSFFLEGELIARIDTDGNGTLDEQEFLTVSQSFISPQRAITNTNTVSPGVYYKYKHCGKDHNSHDSLQFVSCAEETPYDW